MYAYIPNLLTKTEFCLEQTKHVVLAAIVFEGFGGVGFIFGSYGGAILLVIYHVPQIFDVKVAIESRNSV